MLSFLLDEQISAEVQERLSSKRADIPIFSVHTWKDGRFRGTPDNILLHAASAENLTLVTYDQKTIPPLLWEWGERAIAHGGIIFIDNRTIALNNFGALVRSLMWLWDTQHHLEWANRLLYLKAEQ